MSRADCSLPQAESAAKQSGGKSGPYDSAKIAEDIGTAALKLAKRARAAGLTTIAFLLESVALEAGAEAASRHWSVDAPKR